MDIDGKQSSNEASPDTGGSNVTVKEESKGGVKIKTTTTVTVDIDTNGVKTTTKNISKEFDVNGRKSSHESTEPYSDPTYRHGQSEGAGAASSKNGSEQKPEADPIENSEATTDEPAEQKKVETAKDAVKSDRSEAVKDGGSGPEQGSTNENTGRPGYENEQRGC